MDGSELKRLADIEVDVVQPEGNGFTLGGQGSDRGEYRLDLHFDMPLDARTRAVLGGLLAQSELTLWHRPPRSPRATGDPGTPGPRERAHRSRRRVTAD